MSNSKPVRANDTKAIRINDEVTGSCPIGEFYGLYSEPCGKESYAWTCPTLRDGYVDACAGHAQDCIDDELESQSLISVG